jgi:hypothetical protein
VKLDGVRCERCEGERFFHVQRMRDARSAGENVLTWHDRPVAVGRVPIPGAPTEEIAPLGHFETLLCRGCGLTRWYALDWQGLHAPRAPGPCLDCHRDTPHVEIAAVEHASLQGYEQPRITHGMLGREGFLWIRMCEPCGRVQWRGTEYAHLDRKHFVRYRLVDDPTRPCLRCHATAAIVDERVQEFDYVAIPLVVIERPHFFNLVRLYDRLGHFTLRLCKLCGAVEWYAREFEQLAGAAGVIPIGERAPASTGGPYR